MHGHGWEKEKRQIMLKSIWRCRMVFEISQKRRFDWNGWAFHFVSSKGIGIDPSGHGHTVGYGIGWMGYPFRDVSITITIAHAVPDRRRPLKNQIILWVWWVLSVFATFFIWLSFFRSFHSGWHPLSINILLTLVWWAGSEPLKIHNYSSSNERQRTHRPCLFITNRHICN